MMKQHIKNILDTNKVHPLFYVESGSRLWGIESPDSDYDVRGFHLLSKQQYFDFKKHRDIIEVIDGDFDFVSYDIDKMFQLLSKSNPTVFEWIRAHIIYINNLTHWEQLQKDIIENFDFKSLFYHYLSLAKGHLHNMEEGKKFTYKTVFYAIRSLLSADLATQQIIPELLIDQLFKQFNKENDVLLIAKESLVHKKQQTEKEKIPTQQREKILSAIRTCTMNLEAKIVKENNNRKKLENILTEYSFVIKEKYYS